MKKIGGSINKDEHGQIVVYWRKEKKKPEELDQDNNPKTISVLRYYKVFNVAQCRDIPENVIPEVENNVLSPIEECETVIYWLPCDQAQRE